MFQSTIAFVGAAAALLVLVGGAGLPVVAASAPAAKSPDGSAMTMAFSDEFDSFRPFRNGKGVWRTTFRDGSDDHGDDFNLRTLKWNKELQLYVDPEMAAHDGPHADAESIRDRKPGAGGRALGLNPFSVTDGVLSITTDRVPPALRERLGGFAYTSGLISSQPVFTQTYGYFEMRARLPRGKGVWPAFWLLPADFSWPPEIDVMESVGDPSKAYVTLHSDRVKATGTEVALDPQGFHVFGVSWTRAEVVWFVDGREVKRMPTPDDMHKPMYILANVALGGDWAGTPDATTAFPARLQIDWIRAYRFGS